MALSEHDHDITRRYLLGQLTDDEEQKLEERLLSEDDFLQEVELTKDELAQEYVSGELTVKERKWLQENFLASPEGKQKHEFAKTFDHYVRNHRAQRQKSGSFIEWLRNLWRTQPQLLTAASTALVLVIAIGLIGPMIRRPAPQSVAYLTVMDERVTRSGGPSVEKVKLSQDVLELKLMLPQAIPPGSPFRIELMSDFVTRTLVSHAQDAQSITVQIPAAELPPGPYIAKVSLLDAKGNPNQIIGRYPFIVEKN